MARPGSILLGPLRAASSATSVVRALALAAALVACGSKAPPPAPAPPPGPPPAGFSGELAFGHLEQLVGIGPRVTGSEGADRARAYLRTQLEGLGVEVRDQTGELAVRAEEPAVPVHSLVAVVPGESTNLVVLVAPFDSRRSDELRILGANDGASGSAVLLELARVLVDRPLPYTTWLVFADAEAPVDPALSRGQGLIGSRVLLQDLTDTGRIDDVQIVVYFNRVGDRQLSIARDLRSHRQFRNAFFDEARRQGEGDAFPARAPLESPVAGHLVFLKAGMRRSVLIADDRPGGDAAEAAGERAEAEAADETGKADGTPDAAGEEGAADEAARAEGGATPGPEAEAAPPDPDEDGLEGCSAESLGAVGRVSEAALRRITASLAKIDRFARRPIPPKPELEETAPPAEEEGEERAEQGAGADAGADAPDAEEAEAEEPAQDADAQQDAQTPGRAGEAPQEPPSGTPPEPAPPSF